MRIKTKANSKGDNEVLLIPENDLDIFQIGNICSKIDCFEIVNKNEGQFPDPPKIESIGIGENMFLRFLINNA